MQLFVQTILIVKKTILAKNEQNLSDAKKENGETPK
jgi:hypothetical protein